MGWSFRFVSSKSLFWVFEVQKIHSENVLEDVFRATVFQASSNISDVSRCGVALLTLTKFVDAVLTSLSYWHLLLQVFKLVLYSDPESGKQNGHQHHSSISNSSNTLQLRQISPRMVSHFAFNHRTKKQISRSNFVAEWKSTNEGCIFATKDGSGAFSARRPGVTVCPEDDE